MDNRDAYIVALCAALRPVVSFIESYEDSGLECLSFSDDPDVMMIAYEGTVVQSELRLSILKEIQRLWELQFKAFKRYVGKGGETVTWLTTALGPRNRAQEVFRDDMTGEVRVMATSSFMTYYRPMTIPAGLSDLIHQTSDYVNWLESVGEVAQVLQEKWVETGGKIPQELEADLMQALTELMEMNRGNDAQTH